MSFFSDDEAGALSIRRMSLHVVGGDVDFEAQPEFQTIDHADFFLARIQDLAGDSVHEFEEDSETRHQIAAIASGQLNFESGSQNLARRFSHDHVGASRDGAFFVFEIAAAGSGTKFYALIKYDYRQAIELYEEGGRSALRQIVQAFIKDKRAIQKFCVIRTSDGSVATSVSAQDRMGRAPDLTDYFRKFLQVRRDRTDRELNENLNEAVRSTLENCRDLLPDRNVAAAVAAVKDTLRGRESINESAIQEAVFVAAGRPEDEDQRATLEKATQQQIRRKRLGGVEFRPDPQVLRRAPRRLIRTAEGVKIEYPGEQENAAVTRQSTGSGTTITIRTTQRLVEDGTLPDIHSRRT